MMTGKCILLIEDHPESCIQLQAMIKRRNGKAECAHFLKEGIIVEREARLTGNPFDCVISDLGLPDCNIQDVFDFLKECMSHGIPVRAITGVSDPDIIERCTEQNIKVILKGTRAEGIMESVLYALAENPRTGDIKETAVALLENRQQTREVPIHTSWFFTTWPKWGQAAAAFGTVLGVLATITSFSIAFIKSVDARAIARETVTQTAKEYQSKVDTSSEMVALQGGFIRSLQDSRIEIVSKLTMFLQSLTRIEDKVDRIQTNNAKVDAMWKQRLERKTNADLGKEGVIDNWDGPTPSPEAAPTPPQKKK